MENVAVAIRSLAPTDTRAAVARAITIEGFGSRRMGEAVLITARGAIDGRLLGGGADDVLGREAAELLGGAPGATVVEVRLADAPAVAAGLACGGVARVLIQDSRLIPASWWDAISGRRPAALVTDLGGGVSQVVTGQRAAHQSGTGVAETPGQPEQQTPKSPGRRPLDQGERGPGQFLWELAARGADQSASTVRAAELLARRSSVTEVDGDKVIEVWWPTPRVVVLGAAELADAIGRQVALLGWEARLDDGSDPAASTATAAGLGPADALVVLSHDPALAIPALEAALTGEAGYVGALGSRTTQANRRSRLQAAGLDDAVIDRIHGPVGLDLGSRTPEETALAICAEVIATRTGRSATSLRGGGGPING